MAVMNLPEWDAESIKRLPLMEEVVAVIVETRIVPVDPMNTQSLELVFEVVAGPGTGRRITQYLTLWSRDGEVRHKGRAVLNTLFRAMDMGQPSDSSELHNKLLVLWLRRRLGEEDRPRASYLHCSNAVHEDTRRWLKTEGKAFMEHLARNQQESGSEK